MFDFQALVIFGTSFVVGLSGAVAPGPLLALDIRESTIRGFWAGPFIATGHSLLELLVVALLGLGILELIQRDPAFTVVALLGGLLLLWMGWGMVRRPGRWAPPASYGEVQGSHPNPGWPILGGAVVSIANPFWSLWWATVGASFMAWSQSLGLGLLGIVAFYLGHILSDYSWYSAVSLAVGMGRRLMSNSVYKMVMVFCGLFLWAMAGFFIANGLDRAF